MVLRAKKESETLKTTTETTEISPEVQRILDFRERVGGNDSFTAMFNFLRLKQEAEPCDMFWRDMWLKFIKADMTDRMLDVIRDNMQKESPEAQAKREKDLQVLLKEVPLAEFIDYIHENHKKYPTNGFWNSMAGKTETCTFTANMVRAIVDKMPVKDRIIQIEIPAYLARDLKVAKVLEGTITRENSTEFWFEGHAVVGDAVRCFRCGRKLTHPVSLLVGYGEYCCSELGIVWSADVEDLKERISASVIYKGWLPKSKVKIIKK